MIHLLQDVFFVYMAITIMGGLTFATVLTLIVVAVLYSLLFGITAPKSKPSPGSLGTAAASA